jgi:ribose 5-phosphate isomerase B
VVGEPTGAAGRLMRIAVGTDEITAVTDAIERHVSEAGHELIIVGRGAPWPDVGHGVGAAVADGRAERGIAWCWTGTGVSNDANVLAMGLRLTSEPVAVEIVDAFLATDPDGTETANIAAVEPT